MYAWLYRHLPGSGRVRPLVAALLLLGVVALLMFVVFPAVEAVLPNGQVTMGS
ncbi:hypothetical protein MXD59_11865 [Frankia sp. Ag45/Mut15]|uniref:Uncharacterized protein n=1 Tax=Frankia umida TaxID=573489 RepID=A0ABT0JY42_9ACTN|nr:hypothetical protein [Frankia umida]MCK9876461.1 hypothetical protein [Frankia umida]